MSYSDETRLVGTMGSDLDDFDMELGCEDFYLGERDFEDEAELDDDYEDFDPAFQDNDEPLLWQDEVEDYDPTDVSYQAYDMFIAKIESTPLSCPVNLDETPF